MRDKKHPSHSFFPLYKGFSEDYVRDGQKIVKGAHGRVRCVKHRDAGSQGHLR